MTFSEVWQRASGIPPQSISLTEAEFLYSCVPQKGVLVDIGTHSGQSAMLLGLSTSEKVFTIDNYQGQLGMSSSSYMGTFETAAANLASLTNVVCIKEDSLVVARRWKKKLALCFVDGGHDSISVTADIYSWLPHLSKGGQMLFHDYGSWTGVTESVDRALEKVLLRGKQGGSILQTFKR